MDALLWESRSREVQPNDVYKLPKVHEINAVAENFHKVYTEPFSSPRDTMVGYLNSSLRFYLRLAPAPGDSPGIC